MVLVVSTGGEHGEAAADLAPGETVAQRRRAELAGSAAAPGVHRVESVSYTHLDVYKRQGLDSGMKDIGRIRLEQATAPASGSAVIRATTSWR